MAKLTKELVAEALAKHHGIIMHAAEACGCDPRTLRRFIDENPGLEEIRVEAREQLLDIGEKNVIDALLSKDMKTTRWYLERMGKERGYVTRQEQTGPNGGPLEIGQIERVVVKPKS